MVKNLLQEDIPTLSPKRLAKSGKSEILNPQYVMTYLILDIRRKHIDWVGNFNPTNYLLVFLENYSCKVFLVNMLYPSLPLLYTSKNLTKPFLGEGLEKYIQSRKTHRCLLYQISICDIKTIVKRYEK